MHAKAWGVKVKFKGASRFVISVINNGQGIDNRGKSEIKFGKNTERVTTTINIKTENY